MPRSGRNPVPPLQCCGTGPPARQQSDDFRSHRHRHTALHRQITERRIGIANNSGNQARLLNSKLETSSSQIEPSQLRQCQKERNQNRDTYRQHLNRDHAIPQTPPNMVPFLFHHSNPHMSGISGRGFTDPVCTNFASYCGSARLPSHNVPPQGFAVAYVRRLETPCDSPVPH